MMMLSYNEEDAKDFISLEYDADQVISILVMRE